MTTTPADCCCSTNRSPAENAPADYDGRALPANRNGRCTPCSRTHGCAPCHCPQVGLAAARPNETPLPAVEHRRCRQRAAHAVGREAAEPSLAAHDDERSVTLESE